MPFPQTFHSRFYSAVSVKLIPVTNYVKLEYISSVLEKMNDPSYFWRRRYNEKVNETVAMQIELRELEDKFESSNAVEMVAGKLKKKRKVDHSTNQQWRLMDNRYEDEDDDNRKIKSTVELLKAENQLEKDVYLEAGRILLCHLKMWKYRSDESFKSTFQMLIKTNINFLRNKHYAAAKSLFVSVIEWFYEQFVRALNSSRVFYCHDGIADVASTDYRMRYIGSIEICKLLTKKRNELAQPAILNRESKKQQLLSAYYYFISILKITNNTPQLSKLGYLTEVNELQKWRREMERAFFENTDKFTRISSELFLINWNLL